MHLNTWHMNPSYSMVCLSEAAMLFLRTDWTQSTSCAHMNKVCHDALGLYIMRESVCWMPRVTTAGSTFTNLLNWHLHREF